MDESLVTKKRKKKKTSLISRIKRDIATDLDCIISVIRGYYEEPYKPGILLSFEVWKNKINRERQNMDDPVF